MAASISEQVREAVKTLLLAEPQIPEVLGRVERSREDGYSDREAGSINIRAADQQARVRSETIDDNELAVELEIFVATTATWETEADAIHVAAHSRIFAWTGWNGLITRARFMSAHWGGDPGNRVSGLLTVRYAFRFDTRAGAVDAKF